MNNLVLFRKYIRSLDTLELSVLIAFLLFITIGEVCMFKFETSLLGLNNVIEWKLPSPFNSSRFIHSLFRACFYHWSCDLARELPQTSKGNVYIMIMIEHFSKWVEFVALPDKSSHSTSQIVLQQVLSRFRACAECLTYQGLEFRGEFQNLFDHVFIDHHRTSRDHPQVDGLEEKMFQTCKKGLRKICFPINKKDWDLALPYIAMGYKMSKHASLSHFFPYFLLFKIHPIPPFSIVAQMDQVMDLDSLATWVRVIAERATLLKRVTPMAMENFSIAQHRNTL